MGNSRTTITRPRRTNNERLRLRQKVVSRGRSELTRQIKNGTFIELNRAELGIMDEKETMLDKEFLNDIIREIEQTRLKHLVYDPAYKRQALDEWLEQQNKKERKKRIAEKIKSK